jgi:ribosomal protein S18 acetylase RimI-like enzyme
MVKAETMRHATFLVTLGSLVVLTGLISRFYVLGEGAELNLGKLITPIFDGFGDNKMSTPIAEDPTRGMDRGFTPSDQSIPVRESYPIQDQFGALILYATVETIPADSLSPSAVNEIVKAAQSGFGPAMTREDVVAHLQGDVRIARDESGKVIGFLSTTGKPPNEAMNTDVFEQPTGTSMYIMGIAVSADAQGQGVARALIEDALKEFVGEGGTTVSVRTQNQNVVDVVMHGLERLKTAGVIQGYSTEGFVFPGHYGAQLAQHTPRPVPGLNVQNGDALGLAIKVIR